MSRMSRLPSTTPLRAAALALLAALAGCQSAAERAADPILEKNAAARGGAAAWRKVQAMTLRGQLEAGPRRDQAKLAMSYLRQQRESPAQARAAARRAALHPREAPVEQPVQLPYVLELARPRRSRLEVVFQGQTAVQVYDGKRGWKLRPFLGRHEVEPFTAEELRQAALQSDLGGPLLDRDGARVELEGDEQVEGRPAHRLKLTARDGAVRHVWVDAETSLEVKVEGSRRLDGQVRPVFTFLRDYRPEGGLMMPHLLETTLEGAPGSEKIFVERVALNPKLPDAHFGKPE